MPFDDDVRDVPIRPAGADLDQLVGLARRLAPDEQRVLCEVARRLFVGAGSYGALKLATDRRDFRGEASEELLDATIYLAAAALRGGR